MSEDAMTFEWLDHDRLQFTRDGEDFSLDAAETTLLLELLLGDGLLGPLLHGTRPEVTT